MGFVMDNQKRNIDPQKQKKENHIDIKALFVALMKHKNLYFKVLPISFVVACVIALSLPNY